MMISRILFRIRLAIARWRAIRESRRIDGMYRRGEVPTAREFGRLRELFHAARMTPRSYFASEDKEL